MLNKYSVKIGSDDILKTFDIHQTLASGQYFRYELLDSGILFVVDDGLYMVKQDESGIDLIGSKAFDYQNFFDLKRDYGGIQSRLAKKDEHLKAAIKSFAGVRILKQDPFEMIVTFIISQSKQIPQIKVLVERIASTYGEEIGSYNDKTYFKFPRPEALAEVSEETYREMKLGYRAPYIEDCVRKILDGTVDLQAMYDMDYPIAKKMLMTIKGIGVKVADCVLLFAYGKFDAFPIDTWIKKIITEYYFEEPPKDKALKAFVKEYFDESPGLAQQYLFEYARLQKL